MSKAMRSARAMQKLFVGLMEGKNIKICESSIFFAFLRGGSLPFSFFQNPHFTPPPLE